MRYRLRKSLNILVVMGSIKDNINFVIDCQKEMGYYMPKIVKPPASDMEIKIAEDKMGLTFNQELKELYKTLNGVNLEGKIILGKTGIIPIHNLLDLKNAVEYSRYFDWDDHMFLYEIEHDLGDKFFPFIEDSSGNCYWVDLNVGSNHYGKLYWTNTYGDEPGYLFNSLTSFFDAVKKGYSQGIFTLDEEKYLDCDYKKWGVICHEMDKSIQYWKSFVK